MSFFQILSRPQNHLIPSSRDHQLALLTHTDAIHAFLVESGVRYNIPVLCTPQSDGAIVNTNSEQVLIYWYNLGNLAHILFGLYFLLMVVQIDDS